MEAIKKIMVPVAFSEHTADLINYAAVLAKPFDAEIILVNIINERDIETLEKAVRADPQNPDTRVALAEFYLNKGMYNEALEQTRQVLNAYPESESALLIAGLAHVRLEQREAALEPLMRFVDLRKDRPTASADKMLEMAYYFLGESYVALERPEEAIAARHPSRAGPR